MSTLQSPCIKKKAATALVPETAASLIGSTVKNDSSDNAVVTVSSDQAMDKKQGPDDSAGGASKPSKLKLRKKEDTKTP
jgi:hypothetical protein